MVSSAIEVASGLSCLGALAVIVSYLQFSHFRRHPSVIVLILCICDLLTNMDYFSVGIWLVYHGDSSLSGWMCETEGIWSHFWSLSTISWYAMVSVNVLINLYNPFKSTINYLKYYHIYVWFLSSISSLVLFIYKDRIGPLVDGSCGVGDPDDALNLLFYAPLIVYMVLGFITLSISLRHIPDLQDPKKYRASQRRTMMIRLILVIFLFILLWTLPLITVLIEFVRHPHNVDGDLTPLWLVSLISIRIQGLANAVIWLTNPLLIDKIRSRIKCAPKITNEYDEDGETRPILFQNKVKKESLKKFSDFHHLDDVLRRDIIACILRGLRESVLGNTKDSSMYIGSREFPELIANDVKLSASSNALGFRVFDYHPILFAGIREIDGISNSQYLRSLDPETFLAGANLGVSGGQSGSFFCFSPDRKFILKTVYPEEAKFFSSIASSLYRHFLEHKGSMIAKFYGFHGVQVPHGDIVYMAVMANVFDTTLKIHEMYDLKGSWIGRRASDRNPPPPIGLDLDLNRELRVSPEIRLTFLNWISSDVKFLSQLGIIDYSLLLGFHLFEKSTDPRNTNSTLENFFNTSWQKGVLSEDGTELYFAGVIDILQTFTFKKKLELFVKTKLLCKDVRGVSVAPPRKYADRFIWKMGSIFYHEK